MTRPGKLWIPGNTVLDCDLLFVPIHEGIHWTLVVVDFKNKEFRYYDSMHGNGGRHMEKVALFIEAESQHRAGQMLKVSDWPRKNPKPNFPKQGWLAANGSWKWGVDCGIFMLKFSDYESRGKGSTFGQANMSYFRCRLVADLMAQTAD